MELFLLGFALFIGLAAMLTMMIVAAMRWPRATSSHRIIPHFAKGDSRNQK